MQLICIFVITLSAICLYSFKNLFPYVSDLTGHRGFFFFFLFFMTGPNIRNLFPLWLPELYKQILYHLQYLLSLSDFFSPPPLITVQELKVINCAMFLTRHKALPKPLATIWGHTVPGPVVQNFVSLTLLMFIPLSKLFLSFETCHSVRGAHNTGVSQKNKTKTILYTTASHVPSMGSNPSLAKLIKSTNEISDLSRPLAPPCPLLSVFLNQSVAVSQWASKKEVITWQQPGQLFCHMEFHSYDHFTHLVTTMYCKTHDKDFRLSS